MQEAPGVVGPCDLQEEDLSKGLCTGIMPTRSVHWHKDLQLRSKILSSPASNRAIDRPGGGQNSDNQLSCPSRVLLAVGVCSGRRSPASSPSSCSCSPGGCWADTISGG